MPDPLCKTCNDTGEVDIPKYGGIGHLCPDCTREALFARIAGAEAQVRRLQSFHKPTCNAILDDDSDQVLGDFQTCTCALSELEEQVASFQFGKEAAEYELACANGERQRGREREEVLAGQVATLREALNLAYNHLDHFGIVSGPPECARQMQDQQDFFDTYHRVMKQSAAVAEASAATPIPRNQHQRLTWRSRG